MDDGTDISKKFIHAVTNEYSLFLYRFITGGCALLMTWWLLDLRTSTQEMRKDFVAFQLSEEARISKLEGQVNGVIGSIEVHRRRLDNSDNTLQTIWSRIFDMNSRIPQPKN